MKFHPAQGERRRSFGIGGAGNIRTEAEARISYPLPSEQGGQRRSSMWSSISASSSPRKPSIWGDMKGLFKSKSNESSQSKPES
ncbi:hypothetical protein M406DRAFT_321921 [Cryphonectria parasitica EP155]|uniref:Uncharacterized protein n=1 Tax=Cryphonectria parasitica (strain ATCC 38755 / EP155) TaxID=660469 RepID=A0A9P4Y2N8_CRYP1|nr:uncharacterized protein M406DRAFT_321921 [Cryphonectria parasitica EP155]KAF3765383.1 hypothetical protein M406DRAFT_321921 [Cryphonectria parasitica EP155]